MHAQTKAKKTTKKKKDSFVIFIILESERMLILGRRYSELHPRPSELFQQGEKGLIFPFSRCWKEKAQWTKEWWLLLFLYGRLTEGGVLGWPTVGSFSHIILNFTTRVHFSPTHFILTEWNDIPQQYTI